MADQDIKQIVKDRYGKAALKVGRAPAAAPTAAPDFSGTHFIAGG